MNPDTGSGMPQAYMSHIPHHAIVVLAAIAKPRAGRLCSRWHATQYGSLRVLCNRALEYAMPQGCGCMDLRAASGSRTNGQQGPCQQGCRPVWDTGSTSTGLWLQDLGALVCRITDLWPARTMPAGQQASMGHWACATGLRLLDHRTLRHTYVSLLDHRPVPS